MSTIVRGGATKTVVGSFVVLDGLVDFSAGNGSATFGRVFITCIGTQLLYGPPRVPQPNPVGPLRRDQTSIHCLSELKKCFQFALHFPRHTSLQSACAGPLKPAMHITMQVAIAVVKVVNFIRSLQQNPALVAKQ